MSQGPGQRQKVRVVVRVRPELEKEERVWVQVVDKKTLQTINHRNTDETLQYEFESVYGPSTTQACIYNECVKPLLGHTLNGQNASILAYGPTGAGKTHTILGTATDPGVIPRSVKGLFSAVKEEQDRLQASGEKWEFTVSYSYSEIYQEKLQDLLELKGTDLPIREDPNKNIFVTGLSEKVIHNVHMFNKSFGPASNNRTTAATKLNERSSRSHSILLLKVIRKQVAPPHRKLTGKMYIIDLAGSEDNRRTGNKGVRLKESGAINSSLLALGQVVDALQKAQPCIPYRGSKLTRLLQDSLGGNSYSSMIVNLSPEENHYFDTYTTLHFARKAKKVVNVVRTNEVMDKPTSAQRLKRQHSDLGKKAKQAVEPDACTPKKPKLDPTPFLSPLLRRQESFQVSLKDEMCARLEELEERLLKQMQNSTQLSSNVSSNCEVSQSDPDSTTEDLFSSDENISAGKVSRLENMMKDIEERKKQHQKPSVTGSVAPSSTTSSSSNTAAERGRLHQKKGKVYKDGSESARVHMDLMVSNSPLFIKPKVIQKKGFKSTGAKRTEADSSDSQTIERSTGEDSKPSFNPELQKAHNESILRLLNTGTVKELQELQTVGGKRAKLIHSWRELNGHFNKFQDLTAVPGLSTRYMQSFLRGNLVQGMDP